MHSSNVFYDTFLLYFSNNIYSKFHKFKWAIYTQHVGQISGSFHVTNTICHNNSMLCYHHQKEQERVGKHVNKNCAQPN